MIAATHIAIALTLAVVVLARCAEIERRQYGGQNRQGTPNVKTDS